MTHSLKFKIDANNKTRLDVFLTDVLDLSRTKTSYLILNNFVKVNGALVNKNNLILKVGDLIEVDYDDNLFNIKKSEIIPQKMNLQIVYEDDDLIVVNKPKNLITHPTAHEKENTLSNGLLYHINAKVNSDKNIFMVHRLDKDTTGLIVAAKNLETLNALQEQIKSREMKRFYLAIVNHPFAETMGTIDAPIGRTKDESISFTVVGAKNAKKSITKFYVLDQSNRYALVKCELQTGRTHQIRVHMEFIEHWILNDPLYGIRGEQPTEYKQFLHAYQLEFTHPRTKNKIFLECKIDDIFNAKLNELGLQIEKRIDDLET